MNIIPFNNTSLNNTSLNNTSVISTLPVYSVQYIIICGYVILSWGTFNFVSIISKCMLIYILIQ